MLTIFKRKNNDERPCHGIFSVLSNVILCARVFGYLSFSVEFGKKLRNSRVHVSMVDLAWYTVALLVYAMFLFYNDFKNFMNLPYTYIENVASHMNLIVGVVISMFSITMDVLNRKRIWNIFVTLSEFDDEVICRIGVYLLVGFFIRSISTQMSHMGNVIDYKSQKHACHAGLIGLFVISFISEAIGFWALYDFLPIINLYTILGYTTYVIMFSAHSIVWFLYEVFIYNAMIRFREINKFMR